MKLLKYLAFAAAFLVLQGCAFTKATLDVKPSPDVHVAGPLGDVKSIAFNNPQLLDSRADKARIGWKKNGFGQNTADIVSKQPVEDIVETAVAKALTDSRHTVGDNGAIQVVGTVDRFWFDLDVNMWTVKFVGDVQCTLDFIDAQTKQSIYKSKYSGNYSDEKAAGLEKTWTMVLNKAVDKLIEMIVLDEELAAALTKRSTQQVSQASGE
ncbi:YajG family lipoprotein [Steroidobacter flavus]|uniref:YajG family lipoprotein n=1 Tax=Steroidobacter flavus TaxID=1842136 RepID=A0ABV8SW26_9GAMM